MEMEARGTADLGPLIGRSTQLQIWRQLTGTWEDTRATQEIVADIYDNRTPGRDIDL